MRITQSMMSRNLMTNLQGNYKRLDKTQEQLSTNRQLNRPSDNPVGVASALHYRQEISSTNQFSENAEDADSWMQFTDSVINEATQIVQRLSELAVQGGTDTVPKDARENIASEVGQLYNQLVSLGNSQFKGKYIFNGERVDETPFSADPANVSYELDEGEVEYQIGAGITIPVNLSGTKVFGEFSDPNGLFKVVDGLKKSLMADNTSDIQAAISKLQNNLQNLTTRQSEVGGKQNRLTFTMSRLDDLSINYTDLQGKVEDVDMAKAITDLKTSESIYQASLDTMARIIRPSLLDFLR
ncbi:flagellar hook protein [Paenibacillus sp. CAA11]|uniref:flagellar hook-associated protein FlgL n=1 Tax=Paenibacillus sp. CAA11 TaxID=1532905 RepID=UPI000D3D5E7E|nr:flagellar hook-associated protein FlgL [Paenibacillus sp. CAA11]AWB46236.1 flagellar hook protein [Paenibacillus sp. CAA11]